MDVSNILNKIIALLLTVWQFLSDNIYIVIVVAAILAVYLIIRYGKKNMPSKGRITDVYDSAGNQIEKR